MKDEKNVADETLMLKYGQGDVQAFTLLYTRHKSSLYRYFVRQCSSVALAEELFQEVWNKLIKARSNYQDSAKFTTWLYRIAHNELVDYYRRSATYNKVIAANDDHNIDDKSGSSLEYTPSECVSSEHASIQREHDEALYLSQQAHYLKACLAQLPRQQKEAFLLKHEASFTLDEIAELVGESAHNIKSRIRYGLAKLKQCIMHKMGGIDD